MNIFRIHQGYRIVGIGYGLPVFYVDCGSGVSYKPEEVIGKLRKLGLDVGGWVVIRNNPVNEKDMGVLVRGLKSVKVKVEVEDDGKGGTPGWFPEADRWVVDWIINNKFNYGALRPRQDMLICRNGNIENFLEETKTHIPLRAVMVDDRDKVWDMVKDCKEVRVYVK